MESIRGGTQAPPFGLLTDEMKNVLPPPMGLDGMQLQACLFPYWALNRLQYQFELKHNNTTRKTIKQKDNNALEGNMNTCRQTSIHTFTQTWRYIPGVFIIWI